MSDDEIVALRDRVKSQWARPIDVEEYVALADEALARGAEIGRLREECENWQKVVADTVDDMECLPGCNSYGHEKQCPVTHGMTAFRCLREHVAQLETALRFYGEPMTYKAGTGCEYWLVPIEQDKGEKARATLAAGKS